jgi:PleD family two-component response regulator
MIVQRVMRDHGGLIKLDSHAGRGTTFRLWLPLFEPQPRLLEPKPMTKPTLLIVDDEKPTRDGLRAALEDRFEVYVAEDTNAAFELLERERFDVLLTDFRLPREDGLQLIVGPRAWPGRRSAS